MFNFMLIEKYNNIWQTDKPKVNSFTGYQSWNIKAWLFTSYARVKREGYTNFLAFIIISLRCNVYRVHTLPSPILYKSDKNQNITAYWFFVLVYFFKYCISSLIRYVLPLHLLFTCIYERGGMGQTVLAVQAYWKRNAKPTFNWFLRKNETSPFCRFFQTWWKSLFAKNI